MTDTRSAPEAATIDATALGRWMDAEKLPGDGVPVLTRLSGGSQNELFVVERDGIRAVLRIPLATAGAARFDGLRRESRLLRALKGAEVPHAEFVAGTDDENVLGAPFYLMQPVDGWSPMGHGTWPEPLKCLCQQFIGMPNSAPAFHSNVTRCPASFPTVVEPRPSRIKIISSNRWRAGARLLPGGISST